MEWIYIVVSVVALILLIVTFFSIQDKRYKKFVEIHSIKCNKLKSINKRCHFLKIPFTEIEYDFDHEVNFDNISCSDYLIGYMNEHLSEFVNALEDTAANRNGYLEYKEEVMQIGQNLGFDKEPKFLRRAKLLKYEKKLFNKSLIAPTIYFDVTVTLNYVNMGGYLRNYKDEVIKEEQIKKYIAGLKNRSGYYYNDDFIWGALTRYERGKVSLELRFSIYERDNYTCKCCGKHGYRNDLEIDHIVPISRGGKSTYDNLQTLCHDCNYKKGNTNRKY